MMLHIFHTVALVQALDELGVARDAERSRILAGNANARNVKAAGRKAKQKQFPNVFHIREVELDYFSVLPSLKNESIFLRDVAGAVVQLLCDPSVSGPNSEYLDFGQSPAHANELSGSKYIRKLQSTFESTADGKQCYMVTVCIFADGVSVYAGSEKSYVPISMSIAQHTLDVRLTPNGSVLLG